MIPYRLSPRNLAIAFFVATLTMVAVGCGAPSSKHPLSDEKTSVIDERLIGKWEPVDEEHPAERDRRYFIGRLKGKKNTLEVAIIDIDDEGRIDIKRLPMYCKSLNMRTYGSLRFEEDNEVDYLILFYKFIDNENKKLKIHLLNSKAVGADIEAGLLKGVAKRKKRDPAADPNEPVEIEYEELSITASPEELAAYLKKRSPGCFDDEPMTLLRVQR